MVVAVLADGGWKYLSGDFWDADDVEESMESDALVVVPAAIRDELHAHAAEEAPNECCGVLVFSDGVAERYIRGRNRLASPYRYELEIDPEVWFLEDEGYELAVFHSHPETEPRPSRTDRELVGPLGRQAVPDLRARARRAARVADHPGRRRRAAAFLICDKSSLASNNRGSGVNTVAQAKGIGPEAHVGTPFLPIAPNLRPSPPSSRA